MNNTPIGNRLHIGIFGKRNVGKSTFINALTGQNISVVSDVPGTTTDPVHKAMEILPVGPVVLIDTAGFDDEGKLGNLRIEKTYDVLRKTDLAILVVDAKEGIGEFEEKFCQEIINRNIQGFIVLNKWDSFEKDNQNNFAEIKAIFKEKFKLPVKKVSSLTGEGVNEIREFIGDYAKYDKSKVELVGDLINPGDFVVLVTPIDKGAPKGRLILPQQQVIRDIIDHGAVAIVTQENELKETIGNLNKKPALVITDSQVFSKVSVDTPEDIPLTSFSIILARQKGELIPLIKGLKQIEKLVANANVLIVEGCTHHRQADDIGKVKIPRWIKQITGKDMNFEWAQGVTFPKEIGKYDLIIHCGGCMLNKQEMMYRMSMADREGTAITNYGMLIAYIQGILNRALEPFPAVRMELEEGEYVQNGIFR